MLRRHIGLDAVALITGALLLLLVYFGSDTVGAAKPGGTAVMTSTTARAEAQPRPRGLQDLGSVSKRPLRRPSAAQRPSPYRIAFFGDSVSVGYGASDGRRTYVARISQWLDARDKRVIKTVDAKGGVPVAYWTYARMPAQLDAAVVELGTNDVRLGTPLEQFAREYRTLTSRIRVAAPRVRLLCLSVWSRLGWANLERAFNAEIRSACPGTYVDITRFRYLPHIRSSDGFHPNDRGYRLIAQAVLSTLSAR